MRGVTESQDSWHQPLRHVRAGDLTGDTVGGGREVHNNSGSHYADKDQDEEASYETSS